VRSRAAELNIIPDRVGVMGYSAGSRLALNLACHFDRGHADAADPVERFSCRPDFICPLCLWAANNKIDDFPLSKDSPPTFLCIAKDDKISWFAPTVEARLKELGVPVSLQVSLQTYDTGGHEAFTFGHPGEAQKWPGRFLPWLKTIGMLP
jgi:acetyl esterase/lipase